MHPAWGSNVSFLSVLWVPVVFQVALAESSVPAPSFCSGRTDLLICSSCLHFLERRLPDNFGIRCPLADLITSGFEFFFLMEVK